MKILSKFALAILAGTALAIAALPIKPALAGDELTITSWGGAYQESQRKAYFEPFAKKASIKKASKLAGISRKWAAGFMKWGAVPPKPGDGRDKPLRPPVAELIKAAIIRAPAAFLRRSATKRAKGGVKRRRRR